MNRTDKEDMVASLRDIFTAAQVGLLVDYRGLNVAEITELRRRLHEASTNMRVLKNRIAKLAIKETPFSPLEDQLTETRALIYGGDPVAPAKVVSKFLRENAKLRYIAGLLITAAGASLLDSARVRALGNLPSRDELLAQLVYLLKGTQSQFVRTLNEIPARFVRTLAALAATKGEE